MTTLPLSPKQQTPGAPGFRAQFTSSAPRLNPSELRRTDRRDFAASDQMRQFESIVRIDSIAHSIGIGAGNEARTRDLNLGKVALYQLSYSRPKQRRNCRAAPLRVKENPAQYDAKALNWTAIFLIHGSAPDS